jgi:hypothetical protein
VEGAARLPQGLPAQDQKVRTEAPERARRACVRDVGGVRGREGRPEAENAGGHLQDAEAETGGRVLWAVRGGGGSEAEEGGGAEGDPEDAELQTGDGVPGVDSVYAGEIAYLKARGKQSNSVVTRGVEQ